ncbi:Cephalosporin-C deacetylase [compost metagenome]
MSLLDNRLIELNNYNPPSTAKEDFKEFWESNLLHYKNKPLHAKKNKLNSAMWNTEVYHVTYEGFDQTPIHGWYIVPSAKEEKIPCIVIYHGYSSHRGIPEDYAKWIMLGYAVFTVDTRGQTGQSGNRLAQQSGIIKGWVTQGILDRDQSYFKAMAFDCLKGLDWVAEQPEIDLNRICVYGGSQGGGIALQMAALSPIPSLAIANVPNMCNMEFGLFNSNGSLSEITAFVNTYPDTLEQVLDTLSYFDNMNLASRIQVPVHFSVGLRDTICCPETIFAAYNRVESQKEIYVYPFMGHEDGSNAHRSKILAVLSQFSQ